MAFADVIHTNLASGELAKKVRGRADLKIYQNGLERMENFIAETQGPARFRTGSRFVNHTRRNNSAALIPFQFNDSQSYILEFTNLFMRIFRNEGVIIDTADDIDGATKTNPVVVSSNTHSFSNGDEVFISGVVGMTELNNKYFIVASAIGGTSYELTDQDGVDVDGTGFTTYVSGGTAQQVVEVATPYLTADLFQLKFAQNADTMYMVHPSREIRKITRTGHATWTVSRFTRTADPFITVITGITKADPGVVTAAGHGLATGDVVQIEDVVGMTDVNGNQYTVTVIDVNTFSIVDTSGFGVYTSDGYVYDVNDMPGAVAFYEGRLFYGRTVNNPERFWGSRAPSTDGTPRYDDFTTGTEADHAVIFNIAPSTGKVDLIQWLAGNVNFLAMGTFGGISKATGSGQEEPITPNSVNVKPLEPIGCADINPIPQGNILIYVQRGGLVIRSLEFDLVTGSFNSVDRNLVSDDITVGGIIQIAFQNSRPDTLWAVRGDGTLLGLTFKSKEDVSGWHRHLLGGSGAVTSVGVIPMPDSFDQVWLVVERTINSVTRRYIEFFEDEPEIPELIDFFTADANEASDRNTFENAMFEAQKQYIHVDSALSYNGTTPGADASAAVTPAAVTGTGVTFIADASIFAATDVGREIWKKAIVGVGEGRAEITAFVSATEVTCTIKKDFNNVTAMPAGSWYLTTASITGLDHLEGETIAVVTDGAVHSEQTVSSGAITLEFQASRVHVGLQFKGLLKKTNLEVGGVTGPAQTKPKNIEKIVIRFLNTLGARIGTDRYNLKALNFRSTAHKTNRPSPLFSGFADVYLPDGWSQEKNVYIEQISPLPCIVQFFDAYTDTTNE